MSLSLASKVIWILLLEISFLSCEVQKFKKQEIHISEQYTNCPVQFDLIQKLFFFP